MKLGFGIEKGVVGTAGMVIVTVKGGVGMLRDGRLRDGMLRVGIVKEGKLRVGMLMPVKGSVKVGSCRSAKVNGSVGMLRVGMGKAGIVKGSGMSVKGSGISVKGSGISVKGSCRLASVVGSGGSEKVVGTLKGMVGRVRGMVGRVNGIVGRVSGKVGTLKGMVGSVRLGSWRLSTGAAPTRLTRCYLSVLHQSVCTNLAKSRPAAMRP